MSATEAPAPAACRGAAAGAGSMTSQPPAWFEADVATEMDHTTDLFARFDHLRDDLAAAFDDADLAVQRRHKTAVERLATIGDANQGEETP